MTGSVKEEELAISQLENEDLATLPPTLDTMNVFTSITMHAAHTETSAMMFIARIMLSIIYPGPARVLEENISVISLE